MKKRPIFWKVILFLSFVALIINTVEINQIRLQTKLSNAETLIQKVMYNFPTEVKFGQKYTEEDNIEFTVKDKNITKKITAPVVKTRYDFWGDPYYEPSTYSASSKDRRIVYASLNVKSLYKTVASLKDLIAAKIVYAGKYEFGCDVIKLTAEKNDFSKDVEFMPLQSEDIYFVTELPKDFVNTKEPISLELYTENSKYVVKIR